MYVLANMWFQKLMIQFFFNIDKLVYNFISMIYNLLLSIARTSIFSQADIADFAGRIYSLLAVFMVFKVTFSLIMYIVNPDDFADKSKGVSKLATNMVISLSLLILTPYIFNYAYELQTIVLEENVLAKLLMGDTTDDGSYLNNAGDEIAFLTMSAFFTPNTGVEKLYGCTNLIVTDDNGKKIINPDCTGMDSNYNDTNNVNSLYDLTKNDNKYFTVTMLKNYVTGLEYSNIGLMFRQDLAIATDSDGEFFIMDYKYIFSTVIGVVIILILITFCMDIALRSIKLGFLQLVAPIPIISYVDPKSGKDGLFKKWYQMCFSTYISLFVRLLALYFAIYIISKVADLKMVDIIDGSYQTNTFVAIFIIIGALMFAKQLPKILEGLGIKLDGGFTLNPLKKIENDALGGKHIAKVGNTALKYAGRTAKGLATAAGVGAASLLTGHGVRGMGTAMSGALKGEKFGKNWSNSYGAAKARHKEVEEMRANNITPGEVRAEKVRNFFGGRTRAEKVQDVADKSKAIQSNYETIKNQAVSCDAYDEVDKNGKIVKKSAKTISKELDEMKKTQIDRESFKDIGITKEKKYEDKISSYDKDIQTLQAMKEQSKSKTTEIDLNISKLIAEQSTLSRSSFSTDEEFDKANDAYKERIAFLEQEKSSYEESKIDAQIDRLQQQRDNLSVSDFEDDDIITAEQQYADAVEQQDRAIRAKEAELENRIRDLANGDIEVRNASGERVESANKIIEEAKESIIALTKSVNSTGENLDSEFEGIDVKVDSDGKFDVVNAMKQSKGTAAQTTTGTLSKYADIAKYAQKKK